MSRKIILQTVAVLAVIAILTVIIYNLPPVHDRFAWRVELIVTYIRGVISPIESQPVPQESGPADASIAVMPPTPTPRPTLAPTFTPTPGPTATPQPTPTPIPNSVSLAQPAYEKQDWNNCGPATLTMYMRYWGWEGDQFDIADIVKPRREDRNVNVEELQYFVHNYAGWLSYQFRVGGDIEILKKLLAAGFPVMIEEATPLERGYWPKDDKWAGHYLLVTGYDDSTQNFEVVDSYHKEVTTNSYEMLEENWQTFNHVFILVYPLEREETIISILGSEWDPDVNRQAALDESQAATVGDPENAFAWFNYGSNLVYFERYGEAALAYDQARAIGLPQRMLLYQFGPYFAYFHSSRTSELLAVSDYVITMPSRPDSEEAFLWHGWGLYRNGDRSGAQRDFQAALKANSQYYDAQYALDFLAQNP
jgi:tetratricopeptide (TPR) repeat protein